MVAERNGGLRVVVGSDSTLIPSETRREGVAPTAKQLREAEQRELSALLDRYEPIRIPIAELRNIDKAYQREKRERVVKGIVRETVWAALGAPLVSRRMDGTYWVIDGQNRIASVREMLGNEYRLLCVVVPDLTQEQEARVFTIINGNKTRSNTNAVEEFRAALTARDEQTLQINAVLESLGLSVGTTRSPRCLQAAGALIGIWERGRPGDLKRVLQILLEAWPDDPMAFKGVVLTGLYAFLARYRNEPRLRRDRLVERLSTTKPKDVAARGQDIRKDALRSGSLNASPTTSLRTPSAPGRSTPAPRPPSRGRCSRSTTARGRAPSACRVGTTTRRWGGRRMAMVIAQPARLTSGRTLEELEAVVDRGLSAFVEAGRALAEINEQGLYRKRGYTLFEDYLKARWDMAHSLGYGLIAAAEVVSQLSAMAESWQSLPANERQARELVALKGDPQKLMAAWREVLDTAPKDKEGRPVVTAALVRSVVAKHTGAPVSVGEPEPDEAEAPESLVGALAACERVAALAARVSKRLRSAAASGFTVDEANELFSHLEGAAHWMTRADKLKPQRRSGTGSVALPAWDAEACYAALRGIAERQPWVHTDDLAAAYPVSAPEPNAIGYLWQRAKKERVIENTGRTKPSTQPSKNSHEYPVYRSLLYRGES